MQRVDKALVELGLAPSRQKAQAWIKLGLVFSKDGPVKKASERVDKTSLYLSSMPSEVGRGALKLRHALHTFKLSAKNCICLDIGASTGGFTQVWLEEGASKVYAIDVGKDQLNPILKSDQRVVSMEQCNFRTLDPKKLEHLSSRCSIDVSFISSTLILENIKPFLTPDAQIILLIKPQFEVGRGAINKGVVKDKVKRQNAIKKVLDYANKLGLITCGIETSPVLGGKGNIEYLAHLSFNARPPSSTWLDNHIAFLISKE